MSSRPIAFHVPKGIDISARSVSISNREKTKISEKRLSWVHARRFRTTRALTPMKQATRMNRLETQCNELSVTSRLSTCHPELLVISCLGGPTSATKLITTTIYCFDILPARLTPNAELLRTAECRTSSPVTLIELLP